MVANKKSVPAEIRLSKIREILEHRESIGISELARKFKVTEMTIHRDLAKLEQTNAVRKTHGGVVAAERMMFEFDFAARRAANHKAKQAIAQEALKFIKPGDRIIIDTGTTTLELAYLVKDLSDITVITPSLAVASVLQFSKGIQTVLLGGIIRQGLPDLTGAVTEATLDMFAVDIAFQGADGIGLDGAMYNMDIQIARVDQKIGKHAERCFILADSSKVGRTALAKNGMLSEVDAFITDMKIDPQNKKGLEDSGAKVIVTTV
jgi:DeoR/GlpR family transcriptional regulator of sugar metabolism